MNSVPKSIRDYLAAIGAEGGAAKTPAKTTAARENGKRGGRPVGVKDKKPRKRSPANKPQR